MDKSDFIAKIKIPKGLTFEDLKRIFVETAITNFKKLSPKEISEFDNPIFLRMKYWDVMAYVSKQNEFVTVCYPRSFGKVLCLTHFGKTIMSRRHIEFTTLACAKISVFNSVLQNPKNS